MFRRQKEWKKLAEDGRTPYMLGRLIGVNEVAAELLSADESEQAQRVAKVIEQALSFFMDEHVERDGRMLTATPVPDAWPGRAETVTERKPAV